MGKVPTMAEETQELLNTPSPMKPMKRPTSGSKNNLAPIGSEHKILAPVEKIQSFNQLNSSSKKSQLSSIGGMGKSKFGASFGKPMGMQMGNMEEIRQLEQKLA